MSTENLNSNPETTDEAIDSQPNFEQIAKQLEEEGGFNPEEAAQNVAEAEENMEKEPQIPFHHEVIMPGVEMILPRTPKIDEYIMRSQVKTRSKTDQQPPEKRYQVWRTRVFQFHSDARTYEQQYPDPNSPLHDRRPSKEKEVEMTESEARAELQRFIEYGMAGRKNQIAQERTEAAFSRLSRLDPSHYRGNREWIIERVNIDYVQAKREAIARIIDETSFLSRKRLEASLMEELRYLEEFDVAEIREQERAAKKAAKKQDIIYEPSENTEEDPEPDTKDETAEEAPETAAILEHPEAYISYVASQKAADKQAGHTYAEDEFILQKIEAQQERQATDEERPDELPAVTGPVASIEAIDHLSQLVENGVDKKDILKMIYGKDWIENYDKIVDVLFDGNRFQAGQEIIYHMSSEEISSNLGALLQMIDKDGESFPIRVILNRLSDNGQRGISPQEREILARYGYNDYALKQYGF